MNWKDKNYYIKKIKEILGILATAILFVIFLALMFLWNAYR